MRPVAIANTIVYGWRKHMHSSSVFEEDKLQQGAAPAGPERIIHSVNAAMASSPEDTAILLSDISNAYNERARAKMLKLLYARKELKHLWRCADMVYASGPTTLVTSIDGIRIVLETKCTINRSYSRVLHRCMEICSTYPSTKTWTIYKTDSHSCQCKACMTTSRL